LPPLLLLGVLTLLTPPKLVLFRALLPVSRNERAVTSRRFAFGYAGRGTFKYVTNNLQRRQAAGTSHAMMLGLCKFTRRSYRKVEGALRVPSGAPLPPLCACCGYAELWLRSWLAGAAAASGAGPPQLAARRGMTRSCVPALQMFIV